jgi:hypothetical protein
VLEKNWTVGNNIMYRESDSYSYRSRVFFDYVFSYVDFS